MDMKSTGILGVSIVVAALILSLAPRLGSGWGESTGPPMSIHSPDGNLVVVSQVQTSPTSSENSEIANVSDIEFYPAYVVVKTSERGGAVFYNERTRKLSWSPLRR